MEKIRLQLEALSILVAPSTPDGHQGSKDDTPSLRFDNLLKKNLQDTEMFMDKQDITLDPLPPDLVPLWASPTGDTRWMFVVTNLKLLYSIKISICLAMEQFVLHENNSKSEKEGIKNEANNPPQLSPDTLSVKQQKTVMSSLQFITGLGLVPNLLPGVGIPLSKRSGFSHLLEDSSKPEVSDTHLKFCLGVLLDCVKQPSLGSIILSRHLGDVVAALCQLSHSSPAKTQASTAPYTDSREGGRPGLSVSYWKQELDVLVEKIYQPMLVKELLLLQGGASGPPKNQGGSGAVRPPVWLRQTCGRLLSQALMKPCGVKLVLQGIFHGMGVGSGDTAADWRKCDAAAKVIAHCPKNFITPQCYYSAISPQVLDLLRENDQQLAKQYLRVAVSTVIAMVTMYPMAAQQEVIDKLLHPLTCCRADRDIAMETAGVMVVCEKSLSTCMEDIYKVYVMGSGPQPLLLQYLQPVIHTIFMVYCFTSAGVSHHRSLAEDILVLYLKHAEEDVSLASLQLMAYAGLSLSAPCAGLVPMHGHLTFNMGSSGGVVVVTDVVDGRSCMVDWERRAQCITELLTKLHCDMVVAQFFLMLLQELTCIISREVQGDTEAGVSDEDADEGAWLDVQKNLLTLSLLSLMCERLGHECFKNTSHILHFVQVTLERGVEVLSHTGDEALSQFESETLTMAMGLLVAVLEDKSKISPDDRVKTKELLPLLQEISENHTTAEVRDMAGDLRIAIATHGLVQSDLMKDRGHELLTDPHKKKAGVVLEKRTSTKSQVCDVKEAPPNPKLIEVISSCETNLSDTKITTEESASRSAKEISGKLKETLIEGTSSRLDSQDHGDPSHSPRDSGGIENSENEQSAYGQAMEELMDPLLPVRGHALITLHQLVRKRDAETLANQNKVLEIFRENLSHTDSYIYLASIQGLANLADQVPEKVVPVLVEEYSVTQAVNSSVKRTSELRMKIGEALMKASRSLGDTLPHYRTTLMNSVLSVTRDGDPHLRASALANLADICKLLRFSLGPVLHEVMLCVRSLLRSDGDVMVRRGAASVITMLLKGLGTDSLQVLEEVIQELYRLLRHLAETEKDEVVRLHVDMALEEIQRIMNNFLFPSQSFSKKIHIRSAPS